MLSVNEIKRIKEERGLTNRELSDLSGVPLATVQKVLSGVTDSPRYDTMEKLSDVFEKEDILPVRETEEYAAKKQGEYTVDDLDFLPEEKRYEIIDGILIEMESPTTVHQLISGQIFIAIANFIKSNKGDCIPMLAPSDVQIGGYDDKKNILEPDFFIVCKKDKFTLKRVVGAPDFVLEVLSPSTRKKDMGIKAAKYEEAGVREYWIVDPDRKKIIVHIFGEEPDVFIYSFRDKIPVGIYDGKCVVDFSQIDDYVSFIK